MSIKKYLLAAIIIVSSFCILKSDSAIAAEKAQQKELKILVIEIDPYLETKGMKATDYFNSFNGDQSLETSLKELTEDIAYSSNNVISCNIVGKEYLNEFPRYTQQFTLSHLDDKTGERVYNGKGYSLDEATFLDLFRNGWYGWWDSDNPVMKEGIDSSSNKLDYNYLINKFDLVKRKNNNEFDMVWVFGTDPFCMGEVNMVGRNAFLLNGEYFNRDCNNFVITGFSLSRRDVALESIGHLAESMLNYVYGIKNYDAKLDFESLEELNTWQRFYLCKNNAPEGWDEYGCGQVHLSPNSDSFYDWSNLTTVQSTWRDWIYNYPYLTGETTAFDSSVYNDGIMGEDRAHARWWLNLIPHYQGRDDKGYSHNWWDYVTAADYVTSIGTYNTYKENILKDYNDCIILEQGDEIYDLKFILYYRSGKKENFVVDKVYNFLNIKNNYVVDIKDGNIKAEDVGEAKLTLNYDGMSASYKICVVENKRDLYFDGINVNSKLKTLYYNGTTDNETSINITVPDNIKYSVKFTSDDSKIAKVSGKGIITPVGKGTTYITTRIIIGDYSKEYVTKVTSKPASIAFTASKSELTVGQQFTFKAQAYGLSGKLTWSISDPKILSINSDTGKVTAKAAGTAYVIVKNGKFSVKMKVNVRK